jgi:hypothetical protein
MALSQSALSELLEVLRAGDGADLLRESVRMVMQELIDAEAAERIGAGPHERTRSRVTERNGSRPRLVTTQAETSACGSQTPEGVAFPGHPRATPPDRPGPLRGGDRRPRARHLYPQRR